MDRVPKTGTFGARSDLNEQVLKLLAIVGIIGVGLVVTVLVALAPIVGWLISPDDVGGSFELEPEDFHSVPTSQAALPKTG
jgi:hypothetical protein